MFIALVYGLLFFQTYAYHLGYILFTYTSEQCKYIQCIKWFLAIFFPTAEKHQQETQKIQKRTANGCTFQAWTETDAGNDIIGWSYHHTTY